MRQLFKVVLISALVSTGQGAHAWGRVSYRTSTLCGALLNATRSLTSRRAGVSGWEVPDGETALMNSRFEGDAVPMFFRGLETARSQFRGEYWDDVWPADFFSLRPLKVIKNLLEYDYLAFYAGLGFFINVAAVQTLSDAFNGTLHHWPGAVVGFGTFGALGLMDLPWRFAAAYNFALPKIKRGFAKVAAGRLPTFAYVREATISGELFEKLERSSQLDWDDLAAENLREDLPGLWRFAYRLSRPTEPTYRLRVRLQVDRDPAIVRLLVTARRRESRFSR